MAPGTISIFEKKVRNSGLFCLPREVQIHRLALASQPEDDPFTTKLLGHRRGIFSSVLQTERLPGPPLRRLREMGDMGAFIARIEHHTHRFLKQRCVSIDSRLDFYGSRACLGRRYNVTSIASSYLRNNSPPFPEFKEIVRDCATSIARNEEQLERAEPVLSHLDHLPKNYIRVNGRLFVIDWGEGYVGRFGFDAGCFLMVMLRVYDAPQFEREATRFFGSYLSKMVGIEPNELIPAINRVFLSRSLWFLLRPDVVDGIRASGNTDVWRAKLSLLSRFASGEFWRKTELVVARSGKTY